MNLDPNTLPSEKNVGIDPRETGLERLELSLLFAATRPVVLEIGSGKGRFLIHSARTHPQKSFLGIEKSLHYYRVILSRIEKSGLENVKIINFDAFAVLRQMIPDDSLDEVHIYFPDPWPRPKERKRRIIREATLQELARAMKDQAVGIYVTDHEEYFRKAVPLFEEYFRVEAGQITA